MENENTIRAIMSDLDSSPSSTDSPLVIGIILLIIVILIGILGITRYRKSGKKLSKKCIILFVILILFIPILKVNYYSGGCFGVHEIYYKNILFVRLPY